MIVTTGTNVQANDELFYNSYNYMNTLKQAVRNDNSITEFNC
jgi:hypothetical protein